MVEQAHVDRSQTAAFNFVKIPFDEIDNADVTVEDADLKSYLNDNKALYYQTEQTRKLDYVILLANKYLYTTFQNMHALTAPYLVSF